MSPRTGRPPKENPKKVSLNLRLTEACAKDLQDCADKMHTSRTAVIEKGIQKVKSELEGK